MRTKAQQADKPHELGTNHNNNMANTNGLDAIDRWAMGQGEAQKTIHQMTPAKHHINH